MAKLCYRKVTMPLKCCIPKCVSNYKSTGSSVSNYKLPRDEEEKMKWISVIPRSNLVVSKYTKMLILFCIEYDLLNLRVCFLTFLLADFLLRRRKLGKPHLLLLVRGMCYQMNLNVFMDMIY